MPILPAVIHSTTEWKFLNTLKDFLSLRGFKRTDRKSELVARAFGAYELNAPIKFSHEQIYQQIEEEYSRLLISNGIISDLIAATQISYAADLPAI